MTDRCARCKSDTREASVILVCGGPVLCAVCALEEVRSDHSMETPGCPSDGQVAVDKPPASTQA